MSYQPNPALDARVQDLETGAILDVGGWYAPYPLATHVVDLMPYETRALGNFPEPRPGERFTRETWTQADITDPEFRLPYPDGFFAFSILMNTAEDLHEVRPIFRELSRVSRGGFIETPNRLAEQTIGISNRATNRIGYNHHKWIVDLDGDTLRFHDKAESFYQPRRNYAIPLAVTESIVMPRAHQLFWQGSIKFEISSDWTNDRRLAREFKSSLNASWLDHAKDTALRSARQLRNAMTGSGDF